MPSVSPLANRLWQTTLFTALLSLNLVLKLASAQSPPRPLADHWFDDDEWHLDVQYIITPEELSSFKELKTVEERNQFISQFWVRRDPSPNTPQNEFRDEYYRRVEYANTNFADPNERSRRGMEMDRGRVYIMLGPPDEVDRHVDESFEIWRYTALRDAGSDFRIKFTVPQNHSCDGSYRIISPAIESFQGVAESPRFDAQFIHSSVQIYPRHFIAASIPVDFSRVASVAWVLRTQSGLPVLENEDPILEGQLGPAAGDPLSKHFLNCRMFDPAGMAFVHPLPSGSYAFATIVTLTSGEVQRETVRFGLD